MGDDGSGRCNIIIKYYYWMLKMVLGNLCARRTWELNTAVQRALKGFCQEYI